jgi:phospholipase/carboxylesterase
MIANPHMEPPLAFFGAPLTSARAAVILLHGRTQTPEHMFEHAVRRLELDDFVYAAPRAADSTWYPAGFMAPLADNEPRLSLALERITSLSDELTNRGFPPARQVIMGFSQGGCLACEYVYRRRTRFAALIAFTGGLIGPPGTEWSASGDIFRRMPVLLGGSATDPWVPAPRMKETAEVYRRLGGEIDFELHPTQGHEISDAQISRARAILIALSV